MATKKEKEAVWAFPEEDAFGFAGTLRANTEERLGEDAERRLWAEACKAVQATFGEKDAAVVRNFLRSRWGRHLADEACNFAHPETGERALLAGLKKALKRRKQLREGKTGRLAWQKVFDEIKKATLDGTWED